jgi:hypothetical protein
MAKSLKKAPPFRIPTVEEVIEFMDKNMRDWPRSFCEAYGKKFWESYNAKGWQISKYALMKSWESAFWARWANVPYPDDQKLLEKCLQSLTHKLLLDQRRRESAGLFAATDDTPTPLQRTLEFMDGIMTAYIEGNATDKQLRAVGDWLGPRQLLRLKKAQIDRIIIDQGNDADRGRVMAVKQFFENLRAAGQTVSQFYFSRQNPKGEIKTA